LPKKLSSQLYFNFGEKIKNPKLRVRGKLREVYKEKGKEQEKILSILWLRYNLLTLHYVAKI
jgi:hypothetical protein